MGAWGTGIYDNDDAADWGYELEAGGVAVLDGALAVVPVDDYLDGYDATAAIAAADVVARLKSAGGETSAYAEAVIGWVEANQDVAWQHLVPPALAALERVAQPENNELYELWAETDSLEEWLGVLAEVRSRLSRS
jgi:hypothetical protein